MYLYIKDFDLLALLLKKSGEMGFESKWPLHGETNSILLQIYLHGKIRLEGIQFD